MKVLVIGSGGREHAICLEHSISSVQHTRSLFCDKEEGRILVSSALGCTGVEVMDGGRRRKTEDGQFHHNPSLVCNDLHSFYPIQFRKKECE